MRIVRFAFEFLENSTDFDAWDVRGLQDGAGDSAGSLFTSKTIWQEVDNYGLRAADL